MSCTCLACLDGVRIAFDRAAARGWAGLSDEEIGQVTADVWSLDPRMDRRAERLAKAYQTRHEITVRMPTNWKPVAGWFEARGIEK